MHSLQVMDEEFVKHFYTNKDIQREIIKTAESREFAVSFGGKGYGKRPDVAEFPQDLVQFAHKGATSFHVSEERWDNPLLLKTNMSQKEKDDLRIGWDLVLDIDSPYWPISKLTAWLLIEALKDHKIKSISVKFSGNKGFHIGVPFEAFPKQVGTTIVAKAFPDMARSVASYLLDYILTKYIRVEGNNIIKFKTKKISLDKLHTLVGGDVELLKKVCSHCFNDMILLENKKQEIMCPEHGVALVPDDTGYFIVCPKGDYKQEQHHHEQQEDTYQCPNCKTFDYYLQFNTLALIEVDTVLISSRHLYRSQYSLHEKSGRYSLPIAIDSVMTFKKEDADVHNVIVDRSLSFLNNEHVEEDEAKLLFESAAEFSTKKQALHVETEQRRSYSNAQFDEVQEALPEELFPPCIKTILKGLKDGKKRSMFVLINFLSSVGWSHEQIEERMIAWNKENEKIEEGLKEVILLGQLRYHKMNRESILPPNCDNKSYYQDMHICTPDNLCAKVKNPVQYTKRRAFFMKKDEKSKKKVLESA